MDIKKLQTLVVDALEDVKGQDIQLFDTTHLTSLFDRVLIASGTSNRQTKALAASVRDKVKENGGQIVSMEGEVTGEWVLVDLGDMVVHIMQPAIRAYYRLEEIWGDKPVKLGAAKRTARKSASPSDDVADKPKRTSRKPAGKAAPLEVTPDMMAIQTTLDDEPKKTARKPRTTKAADGDVKPARKPAARKTAEGAAAKPAKIPTGARVKVAATKTAIASAKEAAAKRPARKKAAE
ncbi:ribosome silencing factor [Undibacterium oligocarboniphilum]|uniref:Ribosomal silencing factor RsfS n=1 Tax=Undibacterium oligocarboniphilum TaxID=666702 RepID=A0A850QI29_9BURK|nr:ribosome silencing factor [Undibacterium oligocarboniphilum]MBC3869073.1 ribosome silencing factor [Undibacterium oligocarboniphilum]NVO77053.1 ribosome silencing factor [Undibacterium oligocarboniphilum]